MSPENLAQKVQLMVEPLEDRLVLATLINQTTLTYKDIDGDSVEVVFSKPVLLEHNVNQIFRFSTGTVSGSNSTGQILKQLSTDSINYIDAFGLDLTVRVVRKGPQGNGRANVGKLTTLYQSLGKVTIGGDLGEYYLTSPGYDIASVQELQVQSLGRLGPKGGASELSSISYGFVNTIRVLGDVAGGFLHQLYLGDPASAEIGTLEIGGSFRGSLRTDHSIGTVRIGKNIDGTSRAKAFISPNRYPGEVTIGGTVDTFRVMGSILGGSNVASGSIRIAQYDNTTAAVHLFQIGGSIVGGSGDASGSLTVNGLGQAFHVAGSIRGGTGALSGRVSSAMMGELFVGGHIVGNKGQQSGTVFIGDSSPLPISLTIEGQLYGGLGNNSGSVVSRSAVGTATVGAITGRQGSQSGYMEFLDGCDHMSVDGSIRGGDGVSSGSINIYNFQANQTQNQSLIVHGDIRGGKGDWSGNINTYNANNDVAFDGSIVGGSGFHSGVFIARSWSSLSVGRSVIGGTGTSSGYVLGAADVGPVTVNGNILGNSGDSSGVIQVQGDLPHVLIGGGISGGTGANSGGVAVDRRIGQVHIGTELRGGRGTDSGFLMITGNEGPRILDNVWIAGSVRSGIISSTGNLGTISIGGSVVGTRTRPALIKADGNITDQSVSSVFPTLGTLSVAREIRFTDILVGVEGEILEGAAMVGRITVGHNWSHSNLIVGYGAGLDGVFGNDDDVQWNLDEATVVDDLFIEGIVPKSTGANTPFLFMAGRFNDFFVNMRAVILQEGSWNDDLFLAHNVRLFERSLA